MIITNRTDNVKLSRYTLLFIIKPIINVLDNSEIMVNTPILQLIEQIV